MEKVQGTYQVFKGTHVALTSSFAGTGGIEEAILEYNVACSEALVGGRLAREELLGDRGRCVADKRITKQTATGAEVFITLGGVKAVARVKVVMCGEGGVEGSDGRSVGSLRDTERSASVLSGVYALPADTK